MSLNQMNKIWNNVGRGISESLEWVKNIQNGGRAVGHTDTVWHAVGRTDVSESYPAPLVSFDEYMCVEPERQNICIDPEAEESADVNRAGSGALLISLGVLQLMKMVVQGDIGERETARNELAKAFEDKYTRSDFHKFIKNNITEPQSLLVKDYLSWLIADINNAKTIKGQYEVSPAILEFIEQMGHQDNVIGKQVRESFHATAHNTKLPQAYGIWHESVKKTARYDTLPGEDMRIRMGDIAIQGPEHSYKDAIDVLKNMVTVSKDEKIRRSAMLSLEIAGADGGERGQLARYVFTDIFVQKKYAELIPEAAKSVGEIIRRTPSYEVRNEMASLLISRAAKGDHVAEAIILPEIVACKETKDILLEYYKNWRHITRLNDISEKSGLSPESRSFLEHNTIFKAIVKMATSLTEEGRGIRVNLVEDDTTRGLVARQALEEASRTTNYLSLLDTINSLEPMVNDIIGAAQNYSSYLIKADVLGMVERLMESNPAINISSLEDSDSVDTLKNSLKTAPEEELVKSIVEELRLQDLIDDKGKKSLEVLRSTIDSMIGQPRIDNGLRLKLLFGRSGLNAETKARLYRDMILTRAKETIKTIERVRNVAKGKAKGK